MVLLASACTPIRVVGIHMVLVLQAALSHECFENKLYSYSGVCTEDGAELFGISVGKVEYAVLDVINLFGWLLRWGDGG